MTAGKARLRQAYAWLEGWLSANALPPHVSLVTCAAAPSLFYADWVERITGDFQATGIGISYLSDNLVFLRYLEIDGELRKAIGVLKKRVGDFGRTLREISITDAGVVVGAPLTGLRGILTGTSEWFGGNSRAETE